MKQSARMIFYKSQSIINSWFNGRTAGINSSHISLYISSYTFIQKVGGSVDGSHHSWIKP